MSHSYLEGVRRKWKRAPGASQAGLLDCTVIPCQRESPATAALFSRFALNH
jgi:hypothetical protein